MTRIQSIPIAMVLMTCCHPLFASVSVNLRDYMPLHVGDNWTLRDEYGNSDRHEVIGTEVINGELTYQYTNWEGNPGYSNLCYEGTALKMSGTNGMALNPPRIYTGEDIDNPLVHIVYSMVPGVVTPAGVFSDVVKQKIYSKEGSVEILTRVQYLAKGVGLVRDEEWSADNGGAYEYTALLVPNQAGRDWLPMVGLDPDCPDPAGDLYLYDVNSGDLRIVKRNCNRTYPYGRTNQSQSQVVYGERYAPLHQTWIKVYDVVTHSSTLIRTLSDAADPAAGFDSSDLIVFSGDDGTIKQMNSRGGHVVTRIAPEYPYRLRMFWMAPDGKKIVAIENERDGSYETSNYERLVLFNADGSGRRVLLDRYLGDWNQVSWRLDSTGLLYYYRTFNGAPLPYHTDTPHYLTFDLSQDPIVRADLSGSYLGQKDDNVFCYTRSGRLLGLLTGELYDAKTGSFLADRSKDIIGLDKGIMGLDPSGRIYFADREGNGFHEFIE